MASEGFAEPWVAFEDFLGARPLIHGPTVANLLKEWETLGGLLVSKIKEFPAPDTSISIEDRTLNGGLKIRIYTPPDYQKGSQYIGIYIHGGGWAMGDLETDDPDCRAISKRANVILVSVAYRLTPQHKFPAGLNDCVSGFSWALENAETLGGKPDKVFVAGSSAGGGSAFATALKMIDAGNADKLAGVVSQVPCLIHPDEVPKEWKSKYTSYDEHEEHTVNTKSAMYAFWEAYGAPARDKYANPLLHPQLSKLPKVYMTCAGQDTLRDDARLMKEQLEKSGVQLRYDEYPGYPHYFWTFPYASLVEPKKKYLDNLIKGVEFVLS